MPHNQDIVLARDDFTQCMGFDPGLDTCIFFYLLALAAVVIDLVGHLDYRLVTAASQCKVDRRAGKFVILCINQTVQTNTNAQCHRHLIANVDRLYILKQFKALLLHLHYGFFLQNNQIFILFDILADSVEAGNIFVYFSVNQRL